MGSRCRACRDRSQTGCPHSTPIDLAADRGFVQSGFNDVPYLATRKPVAAWDLVEPSSIPTNTYAATGIAAPGSSVSTFETNTSQYITYTTASGATDSTGSTQIESLASLNFGSARIRLFPAVGSGSTQIQQTGELGDASYLNLTTTMIPTLTQTTASSNPVAAPVFYDATGYAGYMELMPPCETPSCQATAPYVYLTGKGYPATYSTGSEIGFLLPAITSLTFDVSDLNGYQQIPVALPHATPTGLLLYIGATSNLLSGGPSIYVIDKVTAGVPSRGIPAGERTFAIGGNAVGNGTSSGLPGVTSGTVTEFAISDGLNPQQINQPGGLNTNQPLPQQFTQPAGGQLAAAFTNYNAFRPEATFASPDPTSRGDTSLLVVSGNQSTPNVAMRADLQSLNNASGMLSGASSASVSVGGIMLFSDGATNPLVLAGSTVGSTRLKNNQLSAAITSNFGSLATGAPIENGQVDIQGGQLLGLSTLNGGQISYFAISQANPTYSAAGAPAAVQPGYVQQIGATSGQSTPSPSQYGYTVLATNVGNPTGQTPPPGPVQLQGFASAVVDHATTNTQTVYAVGTSSLGGFTVNRDANANTFSAALQLAPTAVGQLSSNPSAFAPGFSVTPQTLAFGDVTAPNADTTPRSAFVSSSTFAAVGTNAQASTQPNITANIGLASINNQLLPGIQSNTTTIAHPTIAGASVDASLPASDANLAWGYFLGDLVNSSREQDHVNLGFWVAGVPVGLGTLQTLTGTATYGGGMVGTAVDSSAGTIKTVVGQFAQTWNFSQRTGLLNANYDGARWTSVQTSMPGSSNVYSGTGTAGTRVLSVNGAFFNNGALSANSFPASTGGMFAIQNTAGTYGANGVLVGQLKH